jgi:hypothetical protein
MVSEDALGVEDNAAPGGGDLMVVARLFTPIEAHMLQSRLQVDGMAAVVTDAHIVGVYPFLTVAVGCLRVLVPESDVECTHVVRVRPELTRQVPAIIITRHEGESTDFLAGRDGPQPAQGQRRIPRTETEPRAAETCSS